MARTAPGGQLELLKRAEKHQMGLNIIRTACVVGPGWRPSVFWTKPALKEQLRACMPRVLKGDIIWILQAEGVGREYHTAILDWHGQSVLS